MNITGLLYQLFNFIPRKYLKIFFFNTYNSLTKNLFSFYWCFETKIYIKNIVEGQKELSIQFYPNQFWEDFLFSGYMDLVLTDKTKMRVRIQNEGRNYSFTLPLGTKINIVKNSIHKVDGPFISEIGVDQRSIYFKHVNAEIILTPEMEKMSVLEIATKAGIQPEKGCERGLCGTCKLVLYDGKVRGNSQGKAVYCCQSYPVGKRVVLGA